MAVRTEPTPRTRRERPEPGRGPGCAAAGRAAGRAAATAGASGAARAARSKGGRARRARAALPFAQTKCGGCIALCCRYFAIEVDAPTEPKDFDDLKWYLLHDKVELFTEGRSWYVQVFNRCTNLGTDNRCMDYENRPSICREYENDWCDRDELDDRNDPDGDLSFRTVPELEAYKARWVKRWEARRRRARREAARKAAATRQRRARREQTRKGR
jgi:hypothetical protein